MKSRTITRIGLFAAVVCLFCTSCRDQDFDWEEHYRENVEYQYQEIIKSIFGDIAPDHSWDYSFYSTVGGLEMTTRSTPANGTLIKTVTNNGISSDIYHENGWYEVPSSLITWFNQKLPEKKIIQAKETLSQLKCQNMVLRLHLFTPVSHWFGIFTFSK